MPKVSARRNIENSLHRYGFVAVAGVDEVGRGCLAGPVAVGVVILDSRRPVPGLRDSKLLTAEAREKLSERICRDALAWGIAWAEPDEIDTVNIHQASLRAMARAVMALVPLPDAVLVDGFAIPGLPLPQRAIVGGDRQCAAIAAASIVAKVARDRLMESLHDADPRYGFDRHKGYATPEHLAAVSRHGYSSVHRRSFLCRAFHTPTLFDTIE